MAIRTELNLRLQNTPGALARVCEVLADERLNMLAVALESSGALRLIVDNPIHAAAILRDHHYQVAERDVLYTLAPNDPGTLARIARLLSSEGVNLEYLYVTTFEGEAMASIVAGVPDVQRASAAAGI
jgi:hypothetical protein